MDIKRFDFEYRIAEVIPMLEEKQLYGTKALIRDLKSVVDKTEEIRAKSIDEFAEELKQDYRFESICRDDVSFYEYCKKIERIAEQLKVGNENG